MFETGSTRSEVARRADELRRAGRLAEAEQELRVALDRGFEWTQGVSLLALLLLEQERVREARELLESWARDLGLEAAPGPADSAVVFAAEVSELELESAFETAETDRDQIFDADAIAQQAMRETDFELEGLATRDSIYATQTMAGLLEQQGDERGALRIRAMTRTSASGVVTPSRRDEAVEVLERWLVNLRGGTQ